MTDNEQIDQMMYDAEMADRSKEKEMSDLMKDLIRTQSGRKLFEASKVLEAERQKLLTGPDRQEPEVIFEINDLEDLSARLRDWATTLTAFPSGSIAVDDPTPWEAPVGPGPADDPMPWNGR